MSCREFATVRTIPQDRDSVRNGKDFVQSMCYQDERNSALTHRSDDAKKNVDFLFAERRGRLIEQIEPRILGERANDLNKLLLSNRELANFGVGIDRKSQIEAVEQFSGRRRISPRLSQMPPL